MVNAIEPVKLFTGLIYGAYDLFTAVAVELEKAFGPIEFECEHTDFSYTTYYEKEMGSGLKRTFLSFAEPIMPDRLLNLKLETNEMERRFLNEQGGRSVNIDPGLVGLANVVLASTKAFTHRIYLGKGIFAEVTLTYAHKGFNALPWTYPDYQVFGHIEFFLRVRESLKESIILLRQQTEK